MTQKPKNEYHSGSFPLVLKLLIPLAGLFMVALLTEPSYFFVIAAGLFGILAILIPLQIRLNRSRSAFELQSQDIRERINLIDFSLQKEDLSIRTFQEKIVDFSKLKELTDRLILSLTLDETTDTLSDAVRELLGDEDSTVILYLLHSKTGELGISKSHTGQMKINIKMKQGDGFDHYMAKTMRPLLIGDVKSDYRFDIDKLDIGKDRVVQSLISVPVTIGRKALGILRVDSPHAERFSTQDLRFLTTIGDLGAIAIENAQLYNHVQQLAIKDSLTDLYLRRYLMERMASELTRHLDNGGKLSFLMIDIDKFKGYNDKFGHIAGDIVLKTVGALLGDYFSEAGQLVCRYGGEEFAVMLPDTPKDKAVEMAEELRGLVEQKMVILRREKTKITISVGVATFPDDAKVRDTLINQADQALYQAKNSGRNCVRSAQP